MVVIVIIISLLLSLLPSSSSSLLLLLSSSSSSSSVAAAVAVAVASPPPPPATTTTAEAAAAATAAAAAAAVVVVIVIVVVVVTLLVGCLRGQYYLNFHEKSLFCFGLFFLNISNNYFYHKLENLYFHMHFELFIYSKQFLSKLLLKLVCVRQKSHFRRRNFRDVDCYHSSQKYEAHPSLTANYDVSPVVTSLQMAAPTLWVRILWNITCNRTFQATNMSSDPKGYGKRKRKRHFCGNQFKKVKDVSGEVLDVCEVSRNADKEECARVNSTDNSPAGPSETNNSSCATPTR